MNKCIMVEFEPLGDHQYNEMSLGVKTHLSLFQRILVYRILTTINFMKIEKPLGIKIK